jgi:hypothetical protein
LALLRENFAILANDKDKRHRIQEQHADDCGAPDDPSPKGRSVHQRRRGCGLPASCPSHQRSSVPFRLRPAEPASISAFRHLPHIGASPYSHDPLTHRVAAWRPVAGAGQNSQRSILRAYDWPIRLGYRPVTLTRVAGHQGTGQVGPPNALAPPSIPG